MATPEMREPTFLVLSALADGPKHGYAVTRAVEQGSGGRVTLRAGTLYAALDRLQSEGLVTTTGEEVVDGRLRRYYDLTDTGLEVLAQETRRLRANTDNAARALRARGVTA